MAGFTLAATVQQFLRWLAPDEDEGTTEQKQEAESIASSDDTELDVCHQSPVDRIVEWEKEMEERHQRELENVREEERKKCKMMFEKEMAERQDLVECKVCMEADIQRTFGCGHAACARCARLLVACHVCRSPILQTNRLYLS